MGLLRAGMPQRQIAYECRCSRETVRRVAREKQVPVASRGIRRCPECGQRVVGPCIECANRHAPKEELPREDNRRGRDDPRPWELAEFYRRQDDRRREAGEPIAPSDAERLNETIEELDPPNGAPPSSSRK